MSKKNRFPHNPPTANSAGNAADLLQGPISSHLYIVTAIMGLLILYNFGLPRLFLEIRAAAHTSYGQVFANVSPVKFGLLTIELLKLMMAFTFAAFGGRLIVRLSGFSTLTLPEELALGLGAGLGCISISIFAAGMIGWLNPSFLSSMFLLLTLAVGTATYIGWPQLSTSTPAFVTSDLITRSSSAILLALATINLVAALAPPVFYDSLVYHLALPDLYLLNSRLIPTPHNIYSGVPLNTEMLYAAGLALGGEKLATAIPWGLSIATAISIILCGRRYVSTKAGLLAALLFYSCPMVSGQVWFSLVELNWCFLAFLTVFATMIHLEETDHSWKRSAFIGLLAGITAGTKYNAIVILPAIALIILARRKQSADHNFPNPFVEITIITSISLLLVSPWLARNWAWHGNPLFPFFSTSVDWRGLLRDAQARSILDLVNKPGSAIDMFRSLWSPEWAGGAINEIGSPLLFFSSCLLFLRANDNRVQGFCIAALTGWFFWASSSRLPRFFLATIPFLAILISIAATSERHSPLVRKLLSIGIIIFCGINFLKISTYWYQAGSWSVVLGKESTSDYLQAGQPGYFTPYFAAAEFANHQLPEASKIIFLMESRGYFFKRNYSATSYFAENPLIRLANDASSPEEIRNSLRADGFTHLFVNRAEFFRREAPSPFSPRGSEIFDGFVKRHLKMIFRKTVTSPPAPLKDRQWVEIYEIL